MPSFARRPPTPACTPRSTGCSFGGACRSTPRQIPCCDGSRSSTGPRAVSGARSPWRASTSSARSATRSSRGGSCSTASTLALPGCSGGTATRRWSTRRCSSTRSTRHAATGSTPTPSASPGCGSLSSSSPSRSHRSHTVSLPAPARRRTSTRGGASSALSSGAVGCCGVDGAPSPPTIGPISTRGGTSTTGASCRSSATRSSIPHGRSERAEPPRGGRLVGRRARTRAGPSRLRHRLAQRRRDRRRWPPDRKPLRVGLRDPESGDEVEDEKKLTLAEVAPAVGTQLAYVYDFSDYWRHEVLVVAIDPPGETRSPICLAGERACPPEDCGGRRGYEAFLTAIQDPSHAEHEETLAWAGGRFDPEAFDVQAVNRSLKAMR